MSETMERLARLETQMEQHSEMLEKISTALDKLVEASIANRGNQKAIAENRGRIDDLEADVQRIDSYLRSRWYVIATVVSAVIIITQIAISLFL